MFFCYTYKKNTHLQYWQIYLALTDKSIKCVVADDWKGINTRPVISTKVWSPTNEHTVNRYEMTGNFLPQLNCHIIIEIHIWAALLTTCYIMKPVITKVIHPQSGFDWLRWLESADGFFACSSQKVDKNLEIGLGWF